MTRYAGFMFLHEHDLLELYLRETEAVIDKWILVESTRTFTNKPKPYHFDEQLERFAPWLDRIIRVKVEDNPPDLNPHDRDTWNRQCILRGLKDVKASDLIVLGDVDEIPRASAIAAYDPSRGVCHFVQRMYYWFLNVESPDTPWINCRILPGSFLLDGWTPFRARHAASNPIENGGWHFSSTGGYDALKYKLESFAHADMSHHGETLQWLKDGTLVERVHCVRTAVVPIDETYPKWVRDNVPLMKERGLIYEREHAGI